MDSPSMSKLPPPFPGPPVPELVPLPELVPPPDVAAGDSELIDVLSGPGRDIVSPVDPDKVAVACTDETLRIEFEA